FEIEGFYAGLAYQQTAGLLIGEDAQQGALVIARVNPLGGDVLARRHAPDAAGAEAADDNGSVGSRRNAFRKEVLTRNRDHRRVGSINRAGSPKDAGGDPFHRERKLHALYHAMKSVADAPARTATRGAAALLYA